MPMAALFGDGVPLLCRAPPSPPERAAAHPAYSHAPEGRV